MMPLCRTRGEGSFSLLLFVTLLTFVAVVPYSIPLRPVGATGTAEAESVEVVVVDTLRRLQNALGVSQEVAETSATEGLVTAKGHLQLPFAISQFMKGRWKVDVSVNHPADGLDVAPWGGGSVHKTRKTSGKAADRKALRPQLQSRRLYADSLRGLVELNETITAGNRLHTLASQVQRSVVSTDGEEEKEKRGTGAEVLDGISGPHQALLGVAAAVSTMLHQSMEDGFAFALAATEKQSLERVDANAATQQRSGRLKTGSSKQDVQSSTTATVNLMDAIQQLSADPNAVSTAPSHKSGALAEGGTQGHQYTDTTLQRVFLRYPANEAAKEAAATATLGEEEAGADHISRSIVANVLQELEMLLSTSSSPLYVSAPEVNSLDGSAALLLNAKPHHISGTVVIHPASARGTNNNAAASSTTPSVADVLPADVYDFLASVFVYRVCEIQANTIATPKRVLHGRTQLGKPPSMWSALTFWRKVDEKELLDDGVSTSIVKIRGEMVNALEWLEHAWASEAAPSVGGWQVSHMCNSGARLSKGPKSGKAAVVGVKDRAAVQQQGRRNEEEEDLKGEQAEALAAAVDSPRLYPLEMDIIATYPFVLEAISRASVSGHAEDEEATSSKASTVPLERNSAEDAATLGFRLRDAVTDVHVMLHVPQAHVSSDASVQANTESESTPSLGTIEVRLIKLNPSEQSFFQTHFSTIIFVLTLLLYRGISGYFSNVQ